MAGEAASSGEGKKKMVMIRSSDGQEFEISEETVTAASQMLRNMVEDGCTEQAIPAPNVTGRILALVVEYCNRHYAGGAVDLEVGDDGTLERFDAEFIGGADDNTLFDIILAANYLDVRKLLDLACKRVADEMKGKSVEQIRARFHIVNDYTEEEEAEVRKENSWAFN